MKSAVTFGVKFAGTNVIRFFVMNVDGYLNRDQIENRIMLEFGRVYKDFEVISISELGEDLEEIK